MKANQTAVPRATRSAAKRRPATRLIRRLKMLASKRAFVFMLAFIAAGVIAAPGASGAFTYSGEVIPADPATWVADTTKVYIGQSTDGTLVIDGGSTVSSASLYLGYNANVTGTGTITGTGTRWNVTYDPVIGWNGTGVLNITNGASVDNNNAYLGYNTGSAGTVTVDGTGSRWTSARFLIIGDSGTGTLNIFNGSTVSADSVYVGTNGMVNFGANGGTLRAGNLNGSSTRFTGTGTIVTGSCNNDADWVLATSQDLTKRVETWNGDGRNIGVYVDLSGASGLGRVTIGYQNSGSMVVRNGIKVASAGGYIGYNAGSTGSVTVTGAGSRWTNADGGMGVYVGYFGTGGLTINQGGSVSTANNVYIGTQLGSSGSVAVDGASSTLSSIEFYVGYHGNASLSITNGGKVSARSTAEIGTQPGITGNVIVDGAGSGWSAGSLIIGNFGTGNLTITNGGTVSAGAVLGLNDGGTGRLTVNGAGSSFNGPLGLNRAGTYVSIGNGGTITASTFSVAAGSALTTDVGYGSSLKVGTTNHWTGTITNNGAIRPVASAGAASGTYSPMSYGTMSGSGTVQALGGVWDGTAHTVTVNAAATGTAGIATTFDLANIQRVLITDPASGHSVGAAFQATTAPTNLMIIASAISDLTSLKSQLASGKSVLSAWDFSITQGHTSGNPVYLSLFAGPNQSLSTLNVWHYDGSTWSAFTANDLAYDGTYASFTVTGFSGYALSGTAPVPIPAAVWLLGSGLAGLVGMRRRLFKK